MPSKMRSLLLHSASSRSIANARHVKNTSSMHHPYILYSRKQALSFFKEGAQPTRNHPQTLTQYSACSSLITCPPHLSLFFPSSSSSSSPTPFNASSSRNLSIIDLTFLLRHSLLANRLFNHFPATTAKLRIHHDSLYTYCSVPNSTPPLFPSVDIAYHVFGRGPQKLVFLSGMCVSHSMWSHQLRAFRTNPDYTILLIDNRGSGASSVPPASLASAPGYDITTMARDALAVIRTLWGRNATFHLVGHSMGSMIAQRLAIFTSPLSTHHRILSLTLLSGHDGGWFWNNCPTPVMLRAVFDLVRSAFDDHVTANVHLHMHYTRRFLYEKLLDQTNGHKISRREVYLRRYLDGIRRDKEKDATGATFWGHLASVRSHHLSDDDAAILRNAQFPKMVLYGEEDPVVLPRASRELARRIGAECVEVAGSHFIIDEAACEVNSMLLLNFSKGKKSKGHDQVPVGRFRWIV